MPTLDVHLVEPEREVWAGEAKFVIARSASGDLGVLPGHEPVLSILRIGPVKIELSDGDDVVAAVDGGFLSVGPTFEGVTRVDILAEHVTLQSEVGEELSRIEARIEELQAEGNEDAARRESKKAEVRRRITE